MGKSESVADTSKTISYTHYDNIYQNSIHNAGKIFQFSDSPINDTGTLGKEYQCLLKNKYKWDAGTMTMKPRY